MLTEEERSKLLTSMVRNSDTIRAAMEWLSTYVSRAYETKDGLSDDALAQAASEFDDIADTLTCLVRRG